MEYFSPAGDEAVVLVYQVRGLRGAGVRRVRLYGLQPGQRYQRSIDGAESAGDALMTAGLPANVVEPTDRSPLLD